MTKEIKKVSIQLLPADEAHRVSLGNKSPHNTRCKSSVHFCPYICWKCLPQVLVAELALNVQFPSPDVSSQSSIT